MTVEEEDDLVLDSLLANSSANQEDDAVLDSLLRSVDRDERPTQPCNPAVDRTVSPQRRGPAVPQRTAVLVPVVAQRSAPLICAEEDGSGRGGGGLYPNYVTPRPHAAGDHLRRSLHGAEAPPKSILRKTSSYASFPAAREEERTERKPRRPSFLSMMSSSSVHSRGSLSSSRSASVGLNLDLEDSLPRFYPRAPIRRSCSQPDLVKGAKGAVSEGEGHPMRSRVSFNSVDVR